MNIGIQSSKQQQLAHIVDVMNVVFCKLWLLVLMIIIYL